MKYDKQINKLLQKEIVCANDDFFQNVVSNLNDKYDTFIDESLKKQVDIQTPDFYENILEKLERKPKFKWLNVAYSFAASLAVLVGTFYYTNFDNAKSIDISTDEYYNITDLLEEINSLDLLIAQEEVASDLRIVAR